MIVMVALVTENLIGGQIMKIQESAENYLETILVLHNRTGFVRSIDIANEMNFTKPSVSRATGLLRDEGCITIKQGGQILLTDKGREIAESVYERHKMLTDFFVLLGVDKEVAAEDACRIEHVLSEESFDKLRMHIKNTQSAQ